MSVGLHYYGGAHLIMTMTRYLLMKTSDKTRAKGFYEVPFSRNGKGRVPRPGLGLGGGGVPP